MEIKYQNTISPPTGVMDTIVENGLSDSSSNPGQGS